LLLAEGSWKPGFGVIHGGERGLSKAAGLESFDATVTEVYHSYDAHDGEAAAFFLTAVLRIGLLVFQSIDKGDFGPVDRFESVTTAKASGVDSRVKSLPGFLINLNEQAFFDPVSSPAVWAAITSGNWKFEDSAPRLNEAEIFGAACIGFEKLGKPCPENRDMTEATLKVFGVDFGKEGARKNRLKNDGVSADRVSDEASTRRLNCGLFASLGGGKNSARKAGENGLFGHTFKPYPNRLFVLFCEGKSPEIPLKVVPFGTGSKYRFTSPYSSPEARDLTR
jgi:hypothetical protein